MLHIYILFKNMFKKVTFDSYGLWCFALDNI